jgi:CheY-like chemotaxis protein
LPSSAAALFLGILEISRLATGHSGRLSFDNPRNSPDGVKAMALVLCTGVDAALMKTRQLILEHAGHTVVPACDERAIRAACRAHSIDIAVIEQTMPRFQKLRAFDIVRESCPSAKVLELTAPYAARLLDRADAWLEMPAPSPQVFVDAVNGLVARSAAG